MTDAMRFGPEWLRNMRSGDTGLVGGQGGGSAPSATPTLKLAEFRYGREEMLALFDRNILPPDSLKTSVSIYLEKSLLPLALTEEDNHRGMSSEGPLRGKPGMGPGIGVPGTRGGLGGRGGSVDRGRGRARGSYHYSRGLSYEENDTTNGFIPRRNYDRTQSERGGGWSERNGGDPGDYVSSSPRKEFSSRSLADTNWRRHRGGGEEDDTWRSSRTDKWGRGNSNSWRESENWDRSNNSHPPPRKPWDNEENNLPEWAMENPSESGGSFDATGAFHGGSTYSDEEEVQGETQSRSESTKGATSQQPRPTPHTKKEPPNITNGTSPSPTTHPSSSANSGPLRQSQSATNLVSRHTNHIPITTSASFSGVEKHTPHTVSESREEPPSKPSPPPPFTSQQQPPPPNMLQNKFQSATPVAPPPDSKPVRSSQEEEIERRLQDVENVFASVLMEEEKEPAPSIPTSTPPLGPTPALTHTHSLTDQRWFYQDPQGNVQGPFQPSEMAEWFNSGYFKGNLLVRRACDERYSPLQELCELWNGIPFKLDYYKVSPIKNNDPVLPVMGNESLILQYQLQQQRLLLQRQAAAAALAARLGHPENFNSLTFEQQQLYQANMDMMAQQAGLLGPHSHTSGNVMAMLQQLAQQQAMLQHPTRPTAAQVPQPGPADPPPDPLQQLMQQIGLQAGPTRAAPPTTPPDGERSIDQFMNAFRQRQANPNPLAAPIETVWGGAATAPAFPGWTVPPGHSPLNPWVEPVAKGIKTEQEILEEQMRAEEKKKEELRQQEEMQRLREEEEKIKRLKEQEELERKNKEEEERERKRMQEEEERKKKEAAAKKAEQDRLRKEEEKKRKEEEKRRKEEEKRKQEEERKRVEEEKKKAEEEKKKAEEERKRREEIAKRQNEALKRLQEQQQAARAVKPAPAPWITPETPGPSLADIQKTERKQQQQLREQHERLKAYQEKHAQEQQQQQLKSSKSGSSLNLKWAENPVTSQPTRVKSLAEIQAEEQEQMAKLAEKEKAERIAAAREVTIPAPGSIWASQSLTWAPTTPWGNPVGQSSGQRFWDEVPTTKPATKPSKQAPAAAPQAKSQAKTKAKKEEALVMKLFDKQLNRQNAKVADEFISWCTTILADKPIDIATFVEFLITINSQDEVREYVGGYFKDQKEASDFASGFFERASRFRATNNHPQVRAEPPPPPAQSNNFQEVKGKNKKKNKMTKVDARCLGFNVTAAPDRINVGDRDYGEGV